jgi:hypothetical protein
MKKAVPTRSIVIAAVVALGTALGAASSVQAATAQGVAIGEAARATSPVTKVQSSPSCSSGMRHDGQH